MAETTMNDENKKTIIAFIAGLLIGGLLVFIFANPTDSEPARSSNNTNTSTTTAPNNENDEEADTSDEQNPATSTDSQPVLNDNNGEGSVEVDDQAAGNTVVLDDISFPADQGWIGIRDYQGDQLTGLLGVARWNEAEGLRPKEVSLLRATVAGRTYAVVFYSDNGDKRFDLATDAQLEGSVSSFTAR